MLFNSFIFYLLEEEKKKERKFLPEINFENGFTKQQQQQIS